MTREKVILTYKRKQISYHSDSPRVNNGASSSKHPRTVSAAFKWNETPKEPVIFKKCGSFQDFERSLPNLCSHDSSRNKEGFGKNSSFNDSLDLVVANSVTISSNGIPHNKGSQDSQMSDQNSGVNSSPISFNLTGNNNVHLCKEYSFVDTHVLKEKDFPVEQKNKMVLHKTSNKESFKTPLRTFYRRARERIDVSEGQVLNNLNVGEGEGSASNQNEDLDANCKRKGFTDQSEAPFPVNGNTNSNLSSLNASGKLMARSFEEVACQYPSSGSLAEKKSDSPKGTNFSIKYTQLAQEGTLVTSTSNHSSNTEMREDSSDINHEVKQIKSSKIGTLTEEPGHSSMDDVKKPLVKNPLSNSHFSIRFSSDIDLNEMASDETITSHPCELSKSVRDASHASMFHSRGLSSNAVAEPNGTSKELEYLGIEKQKSRTMSSSPSTANIIPFGEGDALNRNQMQIDSSLLDPTTTKKRLGNIASGGRTLGRSQSSKLSKYRGYPNVWSEEELDSLWIGVRRHGRGNWNYMLRDPRLSFSSGRTPDDLAKRWNVEQSYLLSAPVIQPLRALEPDHLPLPSISGKLSSSIVVDGYIPHSAHLSGGYFKKEGSSDRYGGRHHSKKAHGRTQNHGSAQILKQNSSEKLSSDMGSSSSGANLPHWLRGALHSDQRAAPAFHHLGGQLSPPPSKNSPEGALKRKVPSLLTLPHEPKSSEEPIFRMNQSRPEPMGQIDLVDLDSDASSEGTISDDQSGGC